MSHGNTTLIQLVDSEAIYEIAGSRSGKTHRVWVDLKLCTGAADMQMQRWLRPSADPSPCFEGLAAKSRVIAEGGCFSGLRGRNRDPPPAVQDAQAAVPEGTPLKAVQAGRRNRSARRALH